MATTTSIEWCDHTFNAWRGCTKVAPECRECYAETMSKRNPNALGIWSDKGKRVVAAESYWRLPIQWNAAAKRDGVRRTVFSLSLADAFEDWIGPMMSAGKSPIVLGKDYRASTGEADRLTMIDVRRRLFRLIDETPFLDWLLLTKRPQNIGLMWTPVQRGDVEDHVDPRRSNVWLGTTAGTQETANENVPHLLKCEDLCRFLFVSAEPLLGEVDFRMIPCPIELDREGAQYYDALDGRSYWRTGDPGVSGPSLDWMIVGGESGSKDSRPMNPDWARKIRDDCAATKTPFLFKQWGDFAPRTVSIDEAINPKNKMHEGRPIDWTSKIETSVAVLCKGPKKKNGRLLDGRTHDEFPA